MKLCRECNSISKQDVVELMAMPGKQIEKQLEIKLRNGQQKKSMKALAQWIYGDLEAN